MKELAESLDSCAWAATICVICCIAINSCKEYNIEKLKYKDNSQSQSQNIDPKQPNK